jgi:hypothetical protein
MLYVIKLAIMALTCQVVNVSSKWDISDTSFTCSGLDIPVTIEDLNVAVCLGELIFNGPYERVVIVDRGSSGRIGPGQHDSRRYNEWFIMNRNLKNKSKAISRLISMEGWLLLPLANVCTSYLLDRIDAQSISHFRNKFFTTANTLLVIHGNWPALKVDTNLVKTYKRKNQLCIVHVDEHERAPLNRTAVELSYWQMERTMLYWPLALVARDLAASEPLTTKVIDVLSTLTEHMQWLVVMANDHDVAKSGIIRNIIGTRYYSNDVNWQTNKSAESRQHRVSSHSLSIQFVPGRMWSIWVGTSMTEQYRDGDSYPCRYCRYVFFEEEKSNGKVLYRFNLGYPGDLKDAIRCLVYLVPDRDKYLYEGTYCTVGALTLPQYFKHKHTSVS